MRGLRADKIEIIKGGHVEICMDYGEKFADRSLSCDSDERAWHLFL